MALNENPESWDEVIRDVRKIKETLAQVHDFDVRRIMNEAKERQNKSGRTILPAPSREKA